MLQDYNSNKRDKALAIIDYDGDGDGDLLAFIANSQVRVRKNGHMHTLDTSRGFELHADYM